MRDPLNPDDDATVTRGALKRTRGGEVGRARLHGVDHVALEDVAAFACQLTGETLRHRLYVRACDEASGVSIVDGRRVARHLIRGCAGDVAGLRLAARS